MYKDLYDERLIAKLEKVYKALDVFVKATGLEYDGEDARIMSKVEDYEPYDEMLASIELAHADLGYFLGKHRK